MRLLEAIVAANHGRPAGQPKAQLAGDGAPEGLPIVALTCIDARLNHLLPDVLGVPEESFIWLRNAGNIVTGPLSSTLRSLALACAIKGGREILILGHTDCLVGKSTMLTLTENLSRLGVPRRRLPDNLTEFFGLFASERQNVIKAVDFVRSSPLIGPKVPVHGLLVDIATGRLEWLVNGYQTPATAPVTPLSAMSDPTMEIARPATPGDLLTQTLPDFKPGDFKFPEGTIGETTRASQWLKQVEVVDPQRTDPQPVVAEVDHTGARLERGLDKARRFKIIGSDNKVYGPIQGFQILKWIAEGRIDWKTSAQAEGTPEWRPLSEWAGRPSPPPVPDSPLPPTLKAALKMFKDRRPR